MSFVAFFRSHTSHNQGKILALGLVVYCLVWFANPEMTDVNLTRRKGRIHRREPRGSIRRYGNDSPHPTEYPRFECGQRTPDFDPIEKHYDASPA